MSPRSNLTGAALALLAFGIYAVADSLTKFLGAGYHPLQILGVSMLLAMPVMLTYVLLDREAGPLRPRLPGWMAARMVLATLNSICGVVAFSLLPLAQAYVIFFTMPLLITLLAVPLLGERIDPMRGVAILIGMAGVVIALDPGSVTLGWGHLAALAGAATGGLNYVLMRKTAGVERTAVLMVWPMLAQCLVGLIAFAFVWQPMPVRDLGVALGMSLATVVPLFLMIMAYRRAPAIVIAPMQYSQIGWAALFGALFFDEVMVLRTLAGMVLIAAAGLIVVLRRDPAVAPSASTATPATAAD